MKSLHQESCPPGAVDNHEGGFHNTPLKARIKRTQLNTIKSDTKIIYKRRHTLSGAIIGLTSGWGIMVAVMMLWNYLVKKHKRNTPHDHYRISKSSEHSDCCYFFRFGIHKSLLKLCAINIEYRETSSNNQWSANLPIH